MTVCPIEIPIPGIIIFAEYDHKRMLRQLVNIAGLHAYIHQAYL
jgi:hypothetical protein